MMIYKSIISLFISITLSGCLNSTPQPCEPLVMDRVIYKTKIIKVPVKCSIPRPTCNFQGSGYEPSLKAIECVITQKRYIEACTKSNKDDK